MTKQNFYNKLDLKQKITLQFFFVATFLFFNIYYICLPTIEKIKVMESEITTKKNNLEEKLTRGQNIEALKKNLESIEPKLGFIDKTFINQTRALEFITNLEQIADKNNASQTINLLLENSTKNGDFIKTPLSLKVVGDYDNILTYLNNLDSSSYYINVNDLIIKRDDENLKNIVMTINADTYWK